MSNYPPNGPPPPYGYGQQPTPGSVPGYAYVPAPVLMPMQMYPPQPQPQPQPEPVQPPPTYVTNYIYQQTPQPEPYHPPVATVSQSRPVTFPGLREKLEQTLLKVDQCVTKVLRPSVIDWVNVNTATASTYSHRAFVAGKEGWDDSPLWVIRAHYNGDFVPGKFALKSRAAYIPHGGKEVPVQNFEVLLAAPHALRWLPSSHGQVPAGAIPAGNTNQGETLYIARVNHLRSTTPGKVHPSHGCSYISFGGSEIPYKQYEVLCRIVG
ncbi:unnamed protein product [Arctia plantaginis]|uniref:Uncharacterized protein n=1 Tax=Arctia plantaginis TaxID=874455 RepID=A0A8S0ZRH5_ARCPL|nr:unnamed protein product [Arctia plantaginis]CAB3250735.1 unnamed protein product [Arctia plantaginis]